MGLHISGSDYSSSEVTRYFKLFTCRYLHLLIEKAKFLSLPAKIQAYATNANHELLSSIGLNIRGLPGEIFIFTSENTFYRGSAALRQRDQFQNRTFSLIAVNPLLLMQKIIEEKPTLLHLDFATRDALDIDSQAIEAVAKVAFLSRLTKLREVFVAQNKKGYALSIDFDGKKYALAYFNQEDGGETLKGLQLENPGSKLQSNPIKSLIQNVFSSEFEGLVINPASAKQMLLSKADLQVLQFGLKVCNPEWFSVEWIKQLFRKKT